MSEAKNQKMQVTLPFPPKELNPNQKPHWAVLARIKKKYRELSWVLSLKSGLTPEAIEGWKQADVHLNFFAPDRRARDGDNMLAAMKAGLDGISDALGMDDKHFKVTFDVSDDIGGMVKVTVTKSLSMDNNYKSGNTRIPKARPINTDILSGDYDGKELRPYEGRPGANDALALPSRIGNELHYRDGREVEA